MRTVNQVQAMGLILGETKNGRIFSVTFIKKDGTTRRMSCRRGVKKGLTGTGMRYNPMSKALLPVYDMQKRGYRMVNFDTVVSFDLNGEQYIVQKQTSTTVIIIQKQAS